MTSSDTLHNVLTSVVVVAVIQAIPPLFRMLLGQRLINRKATIRELTRVQANAEQAYQRLERENVRLDRELGEVREELRREEVGHAMTRRELAEIRDRCEHCERLMKLMGRRTDWPEGDPGATP